MSIGSVDVYRRPAQVFACEPGAEENYSDIEVASGHLGTVKVLG